MVNILKRSKMLLFSIIILMSILLLSKNVFAHTLWINATDYLPEIYGKFGARTKFYIGYGHRFPVDDFLPLKEVHDYFLMDSEGVKKKIDPAVSSGFLETPQTFSKEGFYIAAMATK